MLLYQWLKFRKALGGGGAPFNHQEGGGVVADKLFISAKLGGALKISNFITCLYRTVLDVNEWELVLCVKLHENWFRID